MARVRCTPIDLWGRALVTDGEQMSLDTWLPLLVSVSTVANNLALTVGVLFGGVFAFHEYMRRRDLSARLEIQADYDLLTADQGDVLFVSLVVKNFGAVRTLPKKIFASLSEIAVPNDEAVSLYVGEIPVTHGGLRPLDMFMDANESMFRTIAIPVANDLMAAKLTIEVHYDHDEYIAFREFPINFALKRIARPSGLHGGA